MCEEDGGEEQDGGEAAGQAGVAPVVKLAEAIGRVVVVGPLHIQLLNRVVDMLSEFNIFGSRTTSLVFVCGNVGPEALDGGEAVTGDHNIRALPLH